MLNDLLKLLRYRDISLWKYNFLLPVILKLLENWIFFLWPRRILKIFLFWYSRSNSGGDIPVMLNDLLKFFRNRDISLWKINFLLPVIQTFFENWNFFLWRRRILQIFFIFWGRMSNLGGDPPRNLKWPP